MGSEQFLERISGWMRENVFFSVRIDTLMRALFSFKDRCIVIVLWNQSFVEFSESESSVLISVKAFNKEINVVHTCMHTNVCETIFDILS